MDLLKIFNLHSFQVEQNLKLKTRLNQWGGKGRKGSKWEIFISTSEILVILSYPDTKIEIKAFLPTSQNDNGHSKGYLCLRTHKAEKAIQKYNSESHAATTA